MAVSVSARVSLLFASGPDKCVAARRHLARRGDVLVAVDGRSTLVRKSYPRILAYLNECVPTPPPFVALDAVLCARAVLLCRMRSRRAYELTFRLPQVALDAKPAISTRTQYDEASGNLEGYLNKLSKGSMFSKPKWEVRYGICHICIVIALECFTCCLDMCVVCRNV